MCYSNLLHHILLCHKLNSDRHPFPRMSRPKRHLKPFLTIDGPLRLFPPTFLVPSRRPPPPPSALAPIPFLINGAHVQLARRQRQTELHLRHGQVLPHAGTGAALKGPPRFFVDWVQRIPLRYEPALGEKFAGARPEGRVAVHGLVHGPDVHSL